VKADLLVILSITDGLLSEDPAKGTNGKRLSEVSQISQEIEAMAGEGKNELGTGGMKTKLKAAKIVTNAGKGVVFADGTQKDVLIDLFEGKDIGTFFSPNVAKNL